MQNSPGVRCVLGAVEVGEDFPSPSAGTELGSWTAQMGSARAGAVGHISGCQCVARSGVLEQMEKMEKCSRIQEREAESTSQARLPASWHLAWGQGWHGEVCRRQAACSHPASPPGAYLPISAGKVTRVTLPIVHPRNKTPLLPPPSPPQPLLY